MLANMIFFDVIIALLAIIGVFDVILISVIVIINPFIVLIILIIMIFIMMMIIRRGEQVVINAMHFTETTTGSDSRTWYLHRPVNDVVHDVYFTETSNALELEAIAT